MPGITSLPVRTFSPTRRREPAVSATTPFSFSTTTLFITSMFLAVIPLPMRCWLAWGYGIEPGHNSCLPENPFATLHRHLPHIPLRQPRRISALLIPLYIGHGNDLVVGEYQSAVACDHVVEQGFLLFDQGFGEAVVAHGDGQVQPGGAGDEVAGEDYRAVGHAEFGQHQAGGVAVAEAEAPVLAQGGGLLAVL